MKTLIAHRTAAVIMLLTLITAASVQLPKSDWKVDTDNGGQPTVMYYDIKDFPTPRSIHLQLNGQFEPLKGDVTFPGGFRQSLSPDELILYWEHYQGDNALWDLFQSTGKIVSWTPAAGAIPPGFLNQTVRVFADNGRVLIQKLVEIKTSPPGFALAGSPKTGPIVFENIAAREVQMRK
jgi:hypothetical protein